MVYIIPNVDNFDGYLRLCDLKVKIINYICNYDKLFVKIYLRHNNTVDYNLCTLEVLLNSLYLSYNECLVHYYSERICSFLIQTIQLLEEIYCEMKILLEEYPYLDDKITISDILDDVKIDDLDISKYPFVYKYLNMRELIDKIVLFDKYDYKKSLCYKQNVLCIKNNVVKRI